MTDSKTEWRAEFARKYWRVVGVRDGVVVQIIAEFLDEPTALKIAAVNEMEAALEALLIAHSDIADAMGLTGPITGRLSNAANQARGALEKARGA